MASHLSYTRSVNSTFADNGLGGRWGLAHEEGNVFIALSANRGNPGKTGMGLVANDRAGASDRIKIDDLRRFERQAGRALPAKHHPMHDLANEDKDLEEQVRIAGMNWQYDAALTRENVFIGYEDSEYFDLGAIAIPANALEFATLQNTMFDSEPSLPYRDRNRSHATAFRDIDRSLTGTGEYTEIRQDLGDNRSTSVLIDDTCSQRENGRYYVCTGTSGEFDEIKIDGSDATVVNRSSGLTADNELPAGHYETEQTLNDSVSFRMREVAADHSWVFSIQTAKPLDPDPVDYGHQQQITDPEKVSRVTSMEALHESSDPLITLYYDSANNTEYVKLRGTVDYQKPPDEFFYYELSEEDRYTGKVRVEFQQGQSTDTNPPTTPTDLTVESTTNESITLSWSAATDDVSGVEEYIVNVNGTERTRTTQRNVTIGGLTPDTTYELTVQAVDGTGKTSSASSPVTATTAACLSIEAAIDRDDDGEINDTEMLNAIRYWQSNSEVPGTCGKTISDKQMQELMDRWRDG
jgi:hypothetical protein